MFLEICDLWPDADVFTPVYNERGTEGRFAHRDIETSFLQRMRPSARNFRAFLPLYPAAIESFDLSGYDVVISSSSAWAHAVICDERAVHVSYCHNPFRYAWNERHRTLAERNNPVTRAALSRLFRRWREWDWIAAQRVDRYVTNSRTTQARIKAYFGRDSQIVYPPVATERFRPQPVGDHYLVLSELVSHKQIDVAIEAFNRLRLPLVITGGGPDWRRLRSLAGPTIRFAGRVSDEEAARLLASSRALVVTTGEEFGIAAVEAQAAGRPVIARARGRPARERGGRRDRLPLGGRPRRARGGGAPLRRRAARPRGLHRERAPVRLVGVPGALPARRPGGAPRGPVPAARDLAAHLAAPGAEPPSRLAGGSSRHLGRPGSAKRFELGALAGGVAAQRPCVPWHAWRR